MSESHPPHVADSFTEANIDPYNPLRYITSNALTSVAFSLVMIVAITQTYWMKLHGARWMMCMVIAEFCFAFGLVMRYGLHYSPDNLGIYIVEQLFVVLSPCAFIAADYILLSRLAIHLNVPEFLFVTPQRIAKAFILSDVATFTVQANGASAAISKTPTTAKIGADIFLAGLALQLASFVFFTGVYLRFLYLLHKHRPEVWTMDAGKKWHKDWRTLAASLFLSCVGILIRCAYRTAELSQGAFGRLATFEPFFYGLDTLPLFIAIAVYVPFWPGRFIPSSQPAPGPDFAELHAQDLEMNHINTHTASPTPLANSPAETK